MVPEKAAAIIKERHLFGFKRPEAGKLETGWHDRLTDGRS